METGLHEAMAMAEGTMLRFMRTGDRYAPPACARRPCSVMERPMWYQIHVRQDERGEDKACVSLGFQRGKDGAPQWELWVGSDCRWERRLFGGRTLTEDEWELDDAIEGAVAARNAGLKDLQDVGQDIDWYSLFGEDGIEEE